MRDDHAAPPGAQVLVEAEAVDTDVSDSSEPAVPFDGSESLRRILDERYAAAPADLPEHVRAGAFPVQVRDEHGSRAAVDERLHVLRVEGAGLPDDVGEDRGPAGQK